MRFYFENGSKIYKIKGKKHDKIILYNSNFKNHIKIHHPEINLKKIQSILKDPDYVFTPSKSSFDYYYEKDIGKNTYRVVISKDKKNTKVVVTAYKSNNLKRFTTKHIYCVYSKENYKKYIKKQEEIFNEMDYYYELFDIAK